LDGVGVFDGVLDGVGVFEGEVVLDGVGVRVLDGVGVFDGVGVREGEGVGVSRLESEGLLENALVTGHACTLQYRKR
jgi:hypothetical protein